MHVVAVPKKVTYTFDEWFKSIKRSRRISPSSAQPTSVRWIGNERGIAGDPVWHKVKRANITDDVKMNTSTMVTQMVICTRRGS